MPHDLFATGPRDLFADLPKSTLGDVADQAMVGLTIGGAGTLGLSGDVIKLGRAGADAVGLPTPNTPVMGSEEVTKAMGAENPPEPQTWQGSAARTVTSFLPGIVAGPGGVMRRLATQVFAPAAGSEGLGQAAHQLMPAAEPYARAIGGFGGATLPMLAKRIITPLPISPVRQKMVDYLKSEGVTPSAGQSSGSPKLLATESELGGGGGKAPQHIVAEGQFSKAAIRKAEPTVTSGEASTDVVDNMFDRIGGNFGALGARNEIPKPGFGLAMKARQSADDYLTHTLPTFVAPKVESIATDIEDAVTNGTPITGKQYNEWRSQLGAAASQARRYEAKEAIFKMQKALDDEMGANISPADKALWERTRKEYRNALVVSKAASKAATSKAEGRISPASLEAATKTVHGERNYARGNTDFSELAHAGQAIMSPFPQSGTATRSAARWGSRATGAVLGYILGGGHMIGAGELAAGAGAKWGPQLAGQAIMSKPVQAYLGNQVMTNTKDLSRDRQIALILSAMNAKQQFPSQ